MAVPARRVRDLGSRPVPRLAAVPSTGRQRPRLRSRPRRAPFLFFSALVVAGMLILLASAQAIVAQGAFRLSELTDRADRLEVETDMLRLRLAQLSTPDKIAAAGRRAGLTSPTQVEVLGRDGAAS